jgi:hypothetical protein
MRSQVEVVRLGTTIKLCDLPGHELGVIGP